jgi:Flp pilus assembly protein TadG
MKELRAGEQKGVAIVEFVIVLPLLLILTLAVAEFGRAFLQYNTLTQGLHNGVRHVMNHALFGSTGTVVLDPVSVAQTRNMVVFGTPVGGGTPRLPGLSTTDVDVIPIGEHYIRVAATYTYVPIFASIPLFNLGGNIDTFFTFEAAVVGRAL